MTTTDTASTLQPEPKEAEDCLTEQEAPALSIPIKKTQAASIVSLNPFNEGNKPPAKTVSIVAGCTATIALIGAAGIYHSKSLRKRFIDVLKKLTRTKK